MSKMAVIGFGAAGYHGAKAIRLVSPEAEIHVYSNEDPALYNPMLTTYYVKGAIPYEAMFPYGSAEEAAEQLNLRYHGNCAVTGLLPETKTLQLADGREESFDRILIATGASAIMPPIPGLELPGVVKMRTARDALGLKALLDGGTVHSGVVIGASWVGIKVVEDLVGHGAACTLVDGADRMFSTAVFPDTAQRIQRDLEAKGVTVRCNQMLSHIERQADGRLTAVMKSGECFSADMVAVCIGVRMNVGFLKDSGIALTRGVQVDSRMRTSCEGIYAAGDCCEAPDMQSGANRNIGIWTNAVRQGAVAGTNMAGGAAEFGGNFLVNLGHYLDYDFISIGDSSSCTQADRHCRWETGRYFIEACRDSERIKCINLIGGAGCGGVIKNAFLKALATPGAALSTQTVCLLRQESFPDGFIKFLGGDSLDGT